MNHAAAPYSEHAQLSKAAYGDESGVPSHYRKDLELSTSNHSVYHNTKTNKAVIAYRGTDPNNRDDLATDALLAMGVAGSSARFKGAVEVAKRAQRKYGANNVELTGHSLGGTQAVHVSQQLGLKATAFNPGASLMRAVNGSSNVSGLLGMLSPKSAPSRSRATVVHTGVDPISMGYAFGTEKKVYVRPNKSNVHGIENFIT